MTHTAIAAALLQTCPVGGRVNGRPRGVPEVSIARAILWAATSGAQQIQPEGLRSPSHKDLSPRLEPPPGVCRNIRRLSDT